MGIDIGKVHLNSHILPLNEYFKVSDDKNGVAEAVKCYGKLNIERAVIEPAGRYEALFVRACVKADITFNIENLAYLKHFADTQG